MLLHLPTSVSEVQQHIAEGALPIGGATLVWASFQRDGFPERAVSLRNLPEANVLEAEALGSAVVLQRIDDRVPLVLRRAASTIGTGAVRRAATVGGNIVGSTLRCLLPAALVLNARATVLDSAGVYETDLTELLAKRPVLLSINWQTPLVSGYYKEDAPAGGPPPLVIATAVHADADGAHHLRLAVRDGYEFLTATAPCAPGLDSVLHTVESTDIGGLPAVVRARIREEITDVLSRADGS
ncbi:FAD binding domain-containing protein [Streptomyces sp. GXMU-J15]|uniref:FAD binding domain-containing protein n=1 Tax=Streptomyces fuscus TaxID=3048495 RepID=A0ABT7IWM2_9ACTN|nr:FAD binding domain-containing protein [Streptomyces fuscus]MDL2075947.1 FAD binding domain-containing protein [Streptomyces fuscus]